MEIISYKHFENKLKVAIVFSMADGYKLRIEDSESSLSDITCYLTSDGELDESTSYCLPQTDTELLILDWARESIQQYKAGTLYYVSQKAQDERLTKLSLGQAITEYSKCCELLGMAIDENDFITRYNDAELRLENNNY